MTNFVNSTISRFVAAKALDRPASSLAVSDRSDHIHAVLPFKDQASAVIVHVQLNDLSQTFHTTLQPVFVCQNIERDLKLREAKPIVNQPCLVYKFSECDLCDAGDVDFTRRHLHCPSPTCWRTQNLFFINWQVFLPQKSLATKSFTKNFSVLMMRSYKFDCLVYEVIFIHDWDLLSMCNRTYVFFHRISPFIFSIKRHDLLLQFSLTLIAWQRLLSLVRHNVRTLCNLSRVNVNN